MPSPSNGFERMPRGAVRVVDDRDPDRGRCARASRSFRKLDARAIDGPVIAPSRCDKRLRATRGSNNHRKRPVGIFLRAPRRLTAAPRRPGGRSRRVAAGRRHRWRWNNRIAFHRGAGASDRRHADPLTRPGIGAGEPVRAAIATRERPQPPRRLRIGDAGDGKRGLFACPRPLDQHLGAGLGGVEHVEGGPASRGAIASRSAMPQNSSAGTARAIASAWSIRSASAVVERSLDDHIACCRPTNTRKPRPGPRAFELFGLAEPARMRQRDALDTTASAHPLRRVGRGTSKSCTQIDVVGRFLSISGMRHP